MKKSLSLVLAFALLLALAACGGTGGESSAPDATASAADSDTAPAEPVNLKALLESVQQSCSLDSGSIYSSYSDVLGEYMDEEMILGKYGSQSPAPDFGVYAQYAIYFGFETYQDEVALFEVRDEADIETTKRFLQLRIDELLANVCNRGGHQLCPDAEAGAGYAGEPAAPQAD